MNYIKYNYNKKEKFPKFIFYYNYNLIIKILNYLKFRVLKLIDYIKIFPLITKKIKSYNFKIKIKYSIMIVMENLQNKLSKISFYY